MKKFCLLWSALLLALGAVADDFPAVDKNGLQRVDNTAARVVYVRPGATLEPYRRLALLDCYVEFRKGWQRDYNSQVRGTGRRITDADMERIKQDLATEFRAVFTRELETDGGYEIVTEAGPDVLVLRPAILDLVVSAPDTMAPGRTTVIVSSAGEMTLYLELYDSVSNELLARVLDPREARSAAGAGVGNRVNNKAEADRILRRWADTLREQLDAARASAARHSTVTDPNALPGASEEEE